MYFALIADMSDLKKQVNVSKQICRFEKAHQELVATSQDDQADVYLNLWYEIQQLGDEDGVAPVAVEGYVYLYHWGKI